MSELTPQIVDLVIAACQANAGEVGGALGRTLDVQVALGVGEAGTFASDTLPAGPGLAVLLTFGGVGLVAVLPAVSGLIPAWCENPDLTGNSKLSTLAQEFSMLLLPETFEASEYRAARVADIRQAIARSGVATDAACVSLELKSGDKVARLEVVWPLANPTALFDAVKSSAPVAAAATPQPQTGRQRVKNLTELPSYSRSLLKINVPVRVVLAVKKESVQDVVELAAGTIIKFSKSCEESLHLYVGDQQVAEGEAVKVGDKFGFRVTSMTIPDEHFLKIRSNRAS